MKKLFIFAMMLAASVMAVSANEPETLEYEGIWYIMDRANHTATVTYNRAGENMYSGRLIIPAQIPIYSEEEGSVDYAITAIGDNAFQNCPNLSGIIIPNSVETIGEAVAIGSDNIAEVKFEDGPSPISMSEGSFTGAIPYTCTYLYLGRNVADNGGVPPFHTWSSVMNVVIGEPVTEVPLAFCPYARELKTIQVNTLSVLEPGVRMFAFLDEDKPQPDAKAITLYVPTDLVKRYEQHEYWSRFTIEGMDEEQQYNIKYVTSTFDFRQNGLFYQLQEDEYNHKHLAVVMPQVWYLNPDGSYVSTWSSEFPYKYSSVVIPDTVSFWKTGEGAYTRYSGTPVSGWDKYTYPVEIVGDYCFRGAKNLQSVRIPSTVYRVGMEVFEYTEKLFTLTIPESVKETGWLAFARSGLREVVIPASSSNWLESDAAFQECSNLVKVTFAQGTTAIQDRIFFGCTALRIINIPDEVEYIGPGAFAGCEALTELKLPASLKVLNNRLFRGCPIRQLEIPAGVEEIEGSALLGTNIGRVTVNPANRFFDSRENCNAIVRTADNTIVAAANGAFIPASIDSIAEEAFNELEGIRSLTLPANLKHVAYGGFMNLTSLTLLTSFIEKPAGVLEDGAFDSWWDSPCEKATLYVPAGTLAAYRADEQWNKFKNIIEMEGENKPASAGDIEPLGEQGEVNVADIPAGTDLTNAVVNNLYITCDTLNGDQYDAAEQAIVLHTVVDDVMMENILGNPDNDDVIRNNFSGIIFELPAGNGTLKLTVKTEGDHLVAIMISGQPHEFAQFAKDVVEVPYQLEAAARAYIYGSLTELPLAAPTKHMPRRAKADWIVEEEEYSGSISIYGISWETKSTEGINEISQEPQTKSQKLIKNGQLVIERDGKIYNALGTIVNEQ